MKDGNLEHMSNEEQINYYKKKLNKAESHMTEEEKITFYKKQLNLLEHINSTAKKNKNSHIDRKIIKIIIYTVVVVLVSGLLFTVIGSYLFNNELKNKDNCIDKPVIYLYPKNEENVKVRLNTDFPLTATYPKINNNEWNVIASPDGTLKDVKNSNQYSYLYYEGKGKIKFDLSKGFVVKGEDTAEFLENTLTIIGLNDKEKNDFITYWLPRMQKNKYNLIHFSNNEFEQSCKLDVTPKPDKTIRVFMVFKPLDSYINIAPQKINHIDRSGFTIVEWGGTELK